MILELSIGLVADVQITIDGDAPAGAVTAVDAHGVTYADLEKSVDADTAAQYVAQAASTAQYRDVYLHILTALRLARDAHPECAITARVTPIMGLSEEVVI